LFHKRCSLSVRPEGKPYSRGKARKKRRLAEELPSQVSKKSVLHRGKVPHYRGKGGWLIKGGGKGQLPGKARHHRRKGENSFGSSSRRCQKKRVREITSGRDDAIVTSTSRKEREVWEKGESDTSVGKKTHEGGREKQASLLGRLRQKTDGEKRVGGGKGGGGGRNTRNRGPDLPSATNSVADNRRFGGGETDRGLSDDVWEDIWDG